MEKARAMLARVRLDGPVAGTYAALAALLAPTHDSAPLDDARWKSFTAALKTADYHLTFPDDTPVKVFRRGTLSCANEVLHRQEVGQTHDLSGITTKIKAEWIYSWKFTISYIYHSWSTNRIVPG